MGEHRSGHPVRPEQECGDSSHARVRYGRHGFFCVLLRGPGSFDYPSHAGCFVVLPRSYGLARRKRRWAHNLLDKQMHQTMCQMCAAPICAAHHTSQVQILASVPGSCMWHAWRTCISQQRQMEHTHVRRTSRMKAMRPLQSRSAAARSSAHSQWNVLVRSCSPARGSRQCASYPACTLGNSSAAHSTPHRQHTAHCPQHASSAAHSTPPTARLIDSTQHAPTHSCSRLIPRSIQGWNCNPCGRSSARSHP